MGNANYAELEELLSESERIPREFELRLPDAWVRGTIKAGLRYLAGPSVPENVTRFELTVSGYTVNVRADSDPDDWPMVLH